MQFKIVKNRERETGKLPLHLPLQPHLLPHNFSFFFHSFHLIPLIPFIPLTSFMSSHFQPHLLLPVPFQIPFSGFRCLVEWFSFFFSSWIFCLCSVIFFLLFSRAIFIPSMLCERIQRPVKPWKYWLVGFLLQLLNRPLRPSYAPANGPRRLVKT